MASILSYHSDSSPPYFDCLSPSNNPLPGHLSSASLTLSLPSCDSCHPFLHSIDSSPPSFDCLPPSLTLSPLSCGYSPTSLNDHDLDSYTECVKNDQKWAVTASSAYQVTFR